MKSLNKKIFLTIFLAGGLLSFLTQTGRISFISGTSFGDFKKVNYVIDGDTIVLENGEKVRYLGINAPELGQPYSSQALKLNKKLVLNKKVRLEFDIQKRDKYNRLLAYVWSGGVLVNEKLVKEGLAVSETIQPNVKYQDRILKAQQEARKNCRGIWEGLCQREKFSRKKSCVRIVRIQADAPGEDDKNKNGEWIELKNFCDYPVDLKGWLLKDTSSSNAYLFPDFDLGAQKKVRIHSGCGKDTESNLYWQCPEGEYAIWNNSGDHAFLFNNKGKLVDDFEY